MNGSNPNKSAAKDNKAMVQVAKFIDKNPNATYQDVTKEIEWYFDDVDFSPWIVDWIVGHMRISQGPE